MIDVMLLGVGAAPRAMSCFIGWDRASALTDWHLRWQGSLEPDLSEYPEPVVRELPKDHFWPERVVIEANAREAL